MFHSIFIQSRTRLYTSHNVSRGTLELFSWKLFQISWNLHIVRIKRFVNVNINLKYITGKFHKNSWIEKCATQFFFWRNNFNRHDCDTILFFLVYNILRTIWVFNIATSIWSTMSRELKATMWLPVTIQFHIPHPTYGMYLVNHPYV